VGIRCGPSCSVPPRSPDRRPNTAGMAAPESQRSPPMTRITAITSPKGRPNANVRQPAGAQQSPETTRTFCRIGASPAVSPDRPSPLATRISPPAAHRDPERSSVTNDKQPHRITLKERSRRDGDHSGSHQRSARPARQRPQRAPPQQAPQRTPTHPTLIGSNPPSPTTNNHTGSGERARHPGTSTTPDHAKERNPR
jgi:hypothetical protein